jgi:two-component system response regulator (stage 0 sporulation protein F)
MATILVIEDRADERETITQILADAGHVVHGAADGRAAEALLAAEPADLVITDLRMPNKDGLELTMELRARRPSLKIIAMSGQAPGDQLLRVAKFLGATQTLPKPFTPDELLRAVDAVLRAA